MAINFGRLAHGRMRVRPRLLRGLQLIVACRPFSRDPVTDVGWAISEFGSRRFEAGQESYNLAVHKKDVLEIDGHSTPFLFQTEPQRIQILLPDSSANAKDDVILFNDKALDSAGHSRYTFQSLLCCSRSSF